MEAVNRAGGLYNALAAVLILFPTDGIVMEWVCTGSSNLERGQSVEENRDWIMIGSDVAHTDWLYVDGDTDWSGLGGICTMEVTFIKLYGLVFTHVGLDVFDKTLDSFLALLDIFLHNFESQWMVCDSRILISVYQKYQIG